MLLAVVVTTFLLVFECVVHLLIYRCVVLWHVSCGGKSLLISLVSIILQGNLFIKCYITVALYLKIYRCNPCATILKLNLEVCGVVYCRWSFSKVFYLFNP